jgi:molybdate transport system substrate-binding protein
VRVCGSGGASGVYIAKQIDKMGITEQLKSKTKFPASGGFSGTLLTTGEADLAVQQISELKQVGGIEVVGPIPRALQRPAVFSAGRIEASNRTAASDRLLRFLASSEAAQVLRESGLEP